MINIGGMISLNQLVIQFLKKNPNPQLKATWLCIYIEPFCSITSMYWKSQQQQQQCKRCLKLDDVIQVIQYQYVCVCMYMCKRCLKLDDVIQVIQYQYVCVCMCMCKRCLKFDDVIQVIQYQYVCVCMCMCKRCLKLDDVIQVIHHPVCMCMHVYV